MGSCTAALEPGCPGVRRTSAGVEEDEGGWKRMKGGGKVRRHGKTASNCAANAATRRQSWHLCKHLRVQSKPSFPPQHPELHVSVQDLPKREREMTTGRKVCCVHELPLYLIAALQFGQTYWEQGAVKKPSVFTSFWNSSIF